MKRLVLTLVVLATAFSGATPADALELREPYIVAVAPGTPDGALTELATSLSLTITERFHGPIAGFATRMTELEVLLMRLKPGVQFVQRDIAVSAGGKPGGGGGGTPTEVVPPGVRRIGGVTATGTPRQPAGVGVAVLDTGIATTAELDVRGGKNCISTAAPVDDNGHGTHVAGIVGARANGAGTVGVAPGTPVHPVKVLNSRKTGTLSQLLCGLDWVLANAAAQNIRVVNMSILATGSDDGNCGDTNADALHRAVCALTARGILVVGAAGNSKAAMEKTVPAAYSEVLAVTAMTDTDGKPGGIGGTPCSSGDADDRDATVSNFVTAAAAQAHTVAAPGVCVVSTGLSSATATYTGTSQAAPHAAATAALCLNDAGVAGPCASLTVPGIIARLRGDAVAGANGFLGDPARPVTGRFYGPLVSAAGY